MSNTPPARLKQQALELLQTNRVADAIALLDAFVRASPGDAEAWYLLGTAHGIIGSHDPAIRACREAIAIKSDYPEAWCNLGASQHDLRQFEDAIASLSRAIQLRPDYVGALYNLGNSYKEAGRTHEAIDCYKKALALRADANVYINLGAVYENAAQPLEAIACYRHALALDPHNAKAFNNLGNVFALTGDSDAALDHYKRAIALDAGYAQAHNNLGVHLATKNRIVEAIDHYRRALAIQPDFAEAWSNLANAELGRGEMERAKDAYRQAMQLQPNNMVFWSNWLFALNYDPSTSAEKIAQEHARWGRAYRDDATLPPRTHSNPRLRIGYVSPDFRAHPIAHFMADVLANHDPAVVDVFCYANVAHPDAVTERLRSLTPHWQSIRGLSTHDASALIRNDRIDILVDLAGHGAGNRLDVFAIRSAPIQVTWLGYPNTTGLPTVDYCLTDDVLAPDAADQSRYTETLIKLPQFCCFEPPQGAPDVAPAPCLKNGYVTFGSFQNLTKVSEPVIQTWARLLRETPSARLMLQAHRFTDEETKAEFRARFSVHGVTPDRLELRGPTPFIEHLRAHADIDIILDTFPWNGHTTTCHTLWMSVPVIGIAGNTHASRMTADMLRCVGLNELVANNVDEYVSLAVRLAHEHTKIAELRSQIREKMRRSDLCNGPLFTTWLEQAFQQIQKSHHPRS